MTVATKRRTVAKRRGNAKLWNIGLNKDGIDKMFPNGDNTRFGTNVLMSAVKNLVDRGFFPIKAEFDGTKRKFAYLMRDPLGNLFYLVARGTSLFRGEYFGTQPWLAAKAIEKDRPLALYIDGDFYVFDCARMIFDMKGTNQRFGEDMGNFSVKSGLKWDPTTPIYASYRALQCQTDGTI